MPKIINNNRILVLFLLLSFLLINMAVFPTIIGISSSNAANATEQNNPTSSSLSLGVFAFFDYLDAENFSFKIGSGQALQTRRLIEEGFDPLSSTLPCMLFFLAFSTLLFKELNGLFSSRIITEFIHAKDGMI